MRSEASLKSMHLALVLLVAVSVAGCSGDADDGGASDDSSRGESLGVGARCETSNDCAEDLYCHEDLELGVAHGLCTSRCLSQDDCPRLTTCIGAGVCVVECVSNSDCPDGAVCNDSEWCERPAGDPGGLVCAGPPRRCSDRDFFDCERAEGCTFAGCVGTPIRCSVAPCACENSLSRSTCEGIAGCVWGGGCSGTTNQCSDFSADSCIFEFDCNLADSSTLP